MKGSVGMGMLNHLVLGLCPVNEWDRRVRGDDGGRGRGEFGRQRAGETAKK